MNKNLSAALEAVELTYQSVIDMADDVVKDVTGDLDHIVASAYDNIENLSNDAIRDTMLRISLRSYTFSAIKDKSAFKATLAETLRKEAYAKAFSAAEGSVAAKDSNATLSISEEIIVEEMYNLTAALFKTKLDEAHRVVDSLKSVLMSRMQEAKLVAIDTGSVIE